MAETQPDHAGVIAPPPLIYAAGLGVGFLLHKWLPLKLLPRNLPSWLGGLLVGLSFIPGGAAARMFRRANTHLDPFHPTTAIVTRGPYKYTRNPIYLSFTLLYVAIATAVNSLTMLLPLPIVLLVMQRGVIEREEAYLERKFGDTYLRYKTSVRRWI